MILTWTSWSTCSHTSAHSPDANELLGNQRNRQSYLRSPWVDGVTIFVSLYPQKIIEHFDRLVFFWWGMWGNHFQIKTFWSHRPPRKLCLPPAQHTDLPDDGEELYMDYFTRKDDTSPPAAHVPADPANRSQPLSMSKASQHSTRRSIFCGDVLNVVLWVF